MASRRFAAHIVELADHSLYQAFVTLVDGIVVDYSEFSDEMPMTEWLGGKIEIHYDAFHVLRAYWNGRMLE